MHAVSPPGLLCLGRRGRRDGGWLTCTYAIICWFTCAFTFAIAVALAIARESKYGRRVDQEEH